MSMSAKELLKLDDKFAELEKRLEQRETQVARLASQLATAKREASVYYNLLRRLENKVRKTIVVGEHVDTDELFNLRQMVPAKPRLTKAQKQREAYKRGVRHG